MSIRIEGVYAINRRSNIDEVLDNYAHLFLSKLGHYTVRRLHFT